jgi:hypothetical protein
MSETPSKIAEIKIGQFTTQVMIPCSKCGQSPFSGSFSVGADEGESSAAQLFVMVHCATCGDAKAGVRMEIDVGVNRKGQPILYVSGFERVAAKTF